MSADDDDGKLGKYVERVRESEAIFGEQERLSGAIEALVRHQDWMVVRRLDAMLGDLAARLAQATRELRSAGGGQAQRWSSMPSSRLLARACSGCFRLLFAYCLRYEEAACLALLLRHGALCWCLRFFAAVYALDTLKSSQDNNNQDNNDDDDDDIDAESGFSQSELVWLRLTDVQQWALELVALLLSQGVTADRAVPVALDDDSRRALTPSVVRGVLRFVLQRGEALGGLGSDPDSDGQYRAGLHAFLWLASQAPDVVVECLFVEDRAVQLGINLVRLLNRSAAGQFSLLPCLMLLDHLFAGPATANFFFPNDLFVLIDVVVREIGNGCAQSACPAMMPWYLSVLSGIVQHAAAFASSLHLSDAIESTVRLLASTGATFAQNDQVVDGLCSDIIEHLSAVKSLQQQHTTSE